MKPAEQSYSAGVLYVLLAELGWSLSGLFVRLMPGLDGWQINTWRGYWMSVALLCYLIARYGRDTTGKFAEIPLVALITSAGFFALGSTLYVTSLTLVSTATISVIGASSPIFTGLLSPWITGERPGLAAWGAALLAMLGVGIIAWDGLEAGKLIGIVVSVFVPISFAGQTLTLRRYRGYDMVPAICVGGFATFFIAGILGFVAGGHAGGGFEVSPGNLALLAVMGPVQLAVPLIYYARGAKSVPAVTISLIVMLDAVLNPLWPWLFLGETPNRAAFIGGTIIVGAVIISIFGGRWMARAAP
ncbi:MAG: DMT family transporter [Rhizobiales bacterium]|nr:DMT family transporter [Hyphomicrobiales bacterium]MBI3674432.1 DMT family transporter [Hyphomicrobiales bacterium]